MRESSELKGMLAHPFLLQRRDGTISDETRPAFITHAYMQFLTATAHAASYAEAYTVLYAAERAYHDSWRVVGAGIASDSKWRPFVVPRDLSR